VSDHAKVLAEMARDAECGCANNACGSKRDVAALRAGADALDVLALAEGAEEFSVTVYGSDVVGRNAVCDAQAFGATDEAARRALAARLVATALALAKETK